MPPRLSPQCAVTDLTHCPTTPLRVLELFGDQPVYSGIKRKFDQGQQLTRLPVAVDWSGQCVGGGRWGRLLIVIEQPLPQGVAHGPMDGQVKQCHVLVCGQSSTGATVGVNRRVLAGQSGLYRRAHSASQVDHVLGPDAAISARICACSTSGDVAAASLRIREARRSARIRTRRLTLASTGAGGAAASRARPSVRHARRAGAGTRPWRGDRPIAAPRRRRRSGPVRRPAGIGGGLRCRLSLLIGTACRQHRGGECRQGPQLKHPSPVDHEPQTTRARNLGGRQGG